MKNPYLLFRNIRLARAHAGFSQKSLAKKIGVSDKSISAYETGRAIPPTVVLFSIARVTGVSLLQLMGVEQKSSENTVAKKLDNLAEKIFEIGEQAKKSMDVFVGVVLLDKNKNIYLVKEDDKNKIGKDRWNLPGGSVDEGEALIDAAVRETKEETGYSSEVVSQVGCYKCKKGDKSWIYIVFKSNMIDGSRNPVDVIAKDVTEGKWFGPKEFLKMKDKEMVHEDMKLVYDIAVNNKGLLSDSIKFIDYGLR